MGAREDDEAAREMRRLELAATALDWRDQAEAARVLSRINEIANRAVLDFPALRRSFIEIMATAQDERRRLREI